MGRHWRTGDGRELALIHHQLWRDSCFHTRLCLTRHVLWCAHGYVRIHTCTQAARPGWQKPPSPSICELSVACCGVHTSVITTSLWPALNVALFNPWISNLSTTGTCVHPEWDNRWHSGSVDICSYKSFTSEVREFLHCRQVLKPSPF